MKHSHSRGSAGQNSFSTKKATVATSQTSPSDKSVTSSCGLRGVFGVSSEIRSLTVTPYSSAMRAST